MRSTATTVAGSSMVQNVSRSHIEVLLDEPHGAISPDIYGYLLENAGTVIYDGVWVGEDTKIPNVNGIRKALIDRMRELNPSVIRWPGGNFADFYDWRDGVGARSARPRRTNMWWNDFPADTPDGPQRYDPNQFGTAEFMNLCRLTGARPFLNVNVRALPAQEFSRWLEYCNSPPGMTTLADLRKSDGSVEPYGVRYWGIGNEVWAAGGNMTAAEYAALYKRFTASTSGMPTFGVDLAYIASGGPPPATDHRWVREFLAICKNAWFPVPIAGMGLHYYATLAPEHLPPGPLREVVPHLEDLRGLLPSADDFEVLDWYDVLAKSARIDPIISGYWEVIGESDPGRTIKIALDEWGVFSRDDRRANKVDILGRPVTLRDALAAALTLDLLHRHADKLLLANFTGLINQEGGLFRAFEDKFVLTPIYHVFKLYAAHQGGLSVRTVIDAPTIRYDQTGKSVSLAGLYSSASINGHTLTLTVVNPDLGRTVEATIAIRDAETIEASSSVLTHTDMRAQNTFENPNEVQVVSAPLTARGGKLVHHFPPASVTRLTFRLQ